MFYWSYFYSFWNPFCRGQQLKIQCLFCQVIDCSVVTRFAVLGAYYINLCIFHIILCKFILVYVFIYIILCNFCHRVFTQLQFTNISIYRYHRDRVSFGSVTIFIKCTSKIIECTGAFTCVMRHQHCILSDGRCCWVQPSGRGQVWILSTQPQPTFLRSILVLISHLRRSSPTQWCRANGRRRITHLGLRIRSGPSSLVLQSSKRECSQ
jgi:hypothetical protein